MKDFLKQTLVDSGALRAAAWFSGRGAAILMYHSVQGDPACCADSLGAIAHSTVAFRTQMELLAREFSPVSVEQAAGFVKGQGDLPARAVAVTFDDGYADNFEVAAPILRQLSVPAAFYVTVHCVATGELPWPARLRTAFRTTSTDSWRDMGGERLSLRTVEDRDRAFRHACDFYCSLSGASQGDFVLSIERQLLPEPAATSAGRMMTVAQLRQLRAEGQIIGSHSMTHPNLAQLGPEDLGYELEESKRALEGMLGEPVRHFAYPCPSSSAHWNGVTEAACVTAGYETSLTTEGGLVKRGDNRQMLKRVRPGKTVEELRWNLECVFAGRVV